MSKARLVGGLSSILCTVVAFIEYIWGDKQRAIFLLVLAVLVEPSHD